MSDKRNKKESGYSLSVRITCIVLAALTVLGVAGSLVYVLAYL